MGIPPIRRRSQPQRQPGPAGQQHLGSTQHAGPTDRQRADHVLRHRSGPRARLRENDRRRQRRAIGNRGPQQRALCPDRGPRRLHVGVSAAMQDIARRAHLQPGHDRRRQRRAPHTGRDRRRSRQPVDRARPHRRDRERKPRRAAPRSSAPRKASPRPPSSPARTAPGRASARNCTSRRSHTRPAPSASAR